MQSATSTTYGCPMPLTAYSISEEKELDVEQVLHVLSRRNALQESVGDDHIPDSWREFLRMDLECPCCFVTGADIVKEAISRTSKKAIRQACFRFVSPGHRPQCDYAVNESANLTPENLVEFGATNSNLTKAVRELVCSGIHAGAFGQKTIRDMREWFFREKIKTSFQVTLDSQVPRWLDMLWRIASPSLGQLPQGVPLTREIAAMPGFDWSIESARILGERYKATLDVLREKRMWLHQEVDRIESLAKRYHGEIVFDPTLLQPKYEQSLALGRFISENYAPIKKSNRSKYGDVATCVLALSALLLFVNDWNLGHAIATFARISASVGQADQSLGNVMGLNPFHDYEAWRKLRQIQDLGIALPESTDLRAERQKIEAELRARFQA
ncbi:hypothetical protein [Paraburkholderia gardini]|nr:hypothetical protein [Paraburkholderia gardini]